MLWFPTVVALSGINSNNYDKIIKNKQTLAPPIKLDADANGVLPNEKIVNQYGEVEVKKLRKKQKFLTDEERAEIARAYEAGETVVNLAERYGCHKQTISNALKRFGVKVSNDTSRKKLNASVVIDLYEKFHTVVDIAERFGVTPKVILKCLRDHGVAIRSRHDYDNI